MANMRARPRQPDGDPIREFSRLSHIRKSDRAVEAAAQRGDIIGAERNAAHWRLLPDEAHSQTTALPILVAKLKPGFFGPIRFIFRGLESCWCGALRS